MNPIVIIGAGAIGSSLGGLLHRAGHDVRLVGQGDHVRAIRATGLHVEGALGSFTVKIEAAESLQSQPGMAFLTVKSQDVQAAVERNQALLRNVPVVTFQNGVRSDEIVAKFLPKERIASVVVNLHASFLTPGQVTIMYPGPLMIGRPFAPIDSEVRAIAKILDDAFPTRVTNNIRGAHWLKLIVNLNNALPALTNLTLRQVYHDAFLRNLAVGAMREGLKVVARAGIKVESLPDTSVLLAQGMRFLPLQIAGRLAAAKIARMESGWPLIGSTLQSVLRKESTEIDYLNGEVVRLGQQVGIATPINATIVELMHQVEKTGKFYSSETICEAVEATTRQEKAA